MKPQATSEAAEQRDNNPKNPYHWSPRRKASIAILVSFSQLVALMSGSVMAPALPTIARDLRLDTSTTQIAFYVYMLGLGFGPFLVAALSETFGRRPVWIGSHLWYMLWNALCPVGNSGPLLIAGRLLSGFGASVGIAVSELTPELGYHLNARREALRADTSPCHPQLSGPIVADMYSPEKRGRSLAVATFAPYLGPALGPIIGGLMAQKTSWHWLFWVLSIFDAVVVLVALGFLPETYAPVLQRKGLIPPPAPEEPGAGATGPHAAIVNSMGRLRVNITRPVALLFKRPVVQVLAFLLALNFGVYCMILSTFATLWIDKYHYSTTISSLHYIAIAVGCTLATQGGGYLTDVIWHRLRRRAHGVATPEYRVPMMVPGLFLMPLGMLWYGWSAQKHMSWPMVDVGVTIFTLGSFLWAQSVLAYLRDQFTKHAASANAASRVLSYVLGFAFPIFAPQLYKKLGYGWGNTLLALIIIVFAWPAPFFLWKFGERLRAAGKDSQEGD